MKITDKTTFHELQKYVAKVTIERGFDDESAEQKFILLVEEVGELAKAMRHISGLKFADNTSKTELYEELADVQFLLLNVANKLGVDMVEAFEAKEVKNRKRSWN